MQALFRFKSCFNFTNLFENVDYIASSLVKFITSYKQLNNVFASNFVVVLEQNGVLNVRSNHVFSKNFDCGFSAFEVELHCLGGDHFTSLFLHDLLSILTFNL